MTTLRKLSRTSARLEKATAERDALIKQASKEGATRRAVAKAARLSAGRIQQIVGP